MKEIIGIVLPMRLECGCLIDVETGLVWWEKGTDARCRERFFHVLLSQCTFFGQKLLSLRSNFVTNRFLSFTYLAHYGRRFEEKTKT